MRDYPRNKGTFCEKLGCFVEKFSCFWEWWTACFVKSKAKERKVWGAARDEARRSVRLRNEPSKKRGGAARMLLVGEICGAKVWG